MTIGRPKLTTQIESNQKTKREPYLPTFITGPVQYILIAFIAIVGAYSSVLGQYFVIAFAAYVLLFKKDSNLTFTIALFLLATIPFFQVLNQPGIAENMAVYVFELFFVGVIQALVELKFTKNSQNV